MKQVLLILLQIFTSFCLATFLFYKNNTVYKELIFQHEPRIVGGTQAGMKYSKHVASLRLKVLEKKHFGLGHICGGTLISSNTVLTAAHCFLNYQEKPPIIRPEHEFQIVLGTLNRFNKTQYTLAFDVRKIIHKMFHIEDFSNDIGMLILKGEIQNNNPTVKPMEFVTTTPKANVLCQIFGWGVRQLGSKQGSSTLITANVYLFKKHDCFNLYKNNFKPGMICAGVMEGGVDSCQGDSGGSLVYQNKLIGIVSWGEKCGIAGFPGIYTEIEYFKSWIKSSLAEYQNRMNGSKNSTFVVSIRKKSLEKQKFGKGHFCSGVFYIPNNKAKSNLIVTSAYCLYLFNETTPQDLIVVFRAPNKNQKNSKTQEFNVSSFTVHNNFNISSPDFYNIAIVRISIYLNKETINGPQLNNISVIGRDICYTYAWNTILEPFYKGDDLLQVGVAITYNLTECNKIFNNQLKKGMFCAGNKSSLQDEVQADVGGALLCDNKFTGIMLQRFDVAVTGYPSVYTDIGYFKSWLEKNCATRFRIFSYLILLNFVIFAFK